jgi:hypothetical protein
LGGLGLALRRGFVETLSVLHRGRHDT